MKESDPMHIDLRSEAVHIPVRLTSPEDHAIEKTDSSEISPTLQPRISEQLVKFTNISRLLQKQSINLILGNMHALNTFDENGKITGKYFDLNDNFIAIWNVEKDRLYNELADNPDAKLAADEVLDRAKKDDLVKKTDTKILTSAQLIDIFNRE
jgi:hypothetical protein